ncbi:CRISPR-associated endonuclease Cas2 [Coleofasciculus sp. FACHB-64]|uniref:CRISPR-associated endonuclease Cas2 n=1 Tax=Cyanophyceae TaxID=3028117 RepID=UPI001683B1E6|nr:CRISPR-associated endonuclease Cas2 [Coleofasciculus sp. FACHB-64]MBD2045893.1 CRISPR-associated endonuclease Cas2 [Coleofasciculus sp. FACHB-64]
MSSQTLFYLVVYDLRDNKAANKRRKRLHELLCGYGTWTQYSIFECFLTGMQFAKLKVKIEKLINPIEDSVRIYVLDAGAVRKTITYGSQKPRQAETIIL